MDKYGKYFEILKTWNSKMNLVQSDTLQNFFDRHIKDSKRIIPYLAMNEKIIDIGSGAGFPGIVLAIEGFQNVKLCEKNYKKSRFLARLVDELKLNCEVLNQDVFNLSEHGFVSVSRAFANLTELCSVMEVLKSPKGVFHKGRDWEAELLEAQKKWDFAADIYDNDKDSDGVILKITNVRRK